MASIQAFLEDIDQQKVGDNAAGIFEKYLPYAVAFGLERTWVSRFAQAGAPAPDWYGGFGGYGGGWFDPEVGRRSRRRTVWVGGPGWGGVPTAAGEPEPATAGAWISRVCPISSRPATRARSRSSRRAAASLTSSIWPVPHSRDSVARARAAGSAVVAGASVDVWRRWWRRRRRRRPRVRMSRRATVLGCPVDILDPAAFKASLPNRASGDRLTNIVTLNPEQIMAARRDPDISGLLRRAQGCPVDGVGLALALRAQGISDARRITGVDLVASLAELRVPTFLLGGAPGAAEGSRATACGEVRDGANRWKLVRRNAKGEG